jgi:UDP-N-acetylglucosamine--N-acetylmuramyl-(pentapeptide) pyrophosphoryl-undecaprenol N-acetylglucosamine transferase
MPTLFVATAGGHLTQLLDIAGRLPCDGDDVAVWVSNENAQSRSLLEGKNAVFVPEVGRLDVRGVIRSVPHAHRLHREWGFSRVVSTGSALALGYLPYLSARGVRAHYIESATRLTRPSVTGRLLRAVPGIRLYTQYEQTAQGPWHYAGCVFDRFVATKETECASVDRAVVVLGTMTDFQFRRMLDALAPLLGRGGVLEQQQGSPVETLWQTGSTPTDGLDIDARPWVPSAELDAAIAGADLVVSHAGTGSALTTLTAGRLPILIPRDDARGEIGDGHQHLLARELETRGIAMYREPDTVTVEDLLAAATHHVEAAAVMKPLNLLP